MSIQINNPSKGGIPGTRAINTTSPLSGGGDLTADRTLSIPSATAISDGYLTSGYFSIFDNKLTESSADTKYLKLDASNDPLTGELVSNKNFIFTNAVSGTPGTPSQINTGDPNTKGLIVKGNTYTNPGVQPDTVSGLKLWLKADAIVGLNDGDSVATWIDSSGQSHDATQSTAGFKPLYKANVINGKPVIRFDGSDDVLSTNTINENIGTMFAVMDIRTFTGVVPSLGGMSGGGTIYRIMSIFPLITDSFSNTDDLLNVQSYIDGALTNTLPSGFFIRVKATAPTAINNAVTIGYNSSNTTYSNIDVAEVIFYNTQLSDVNRQNVESYLANKYGITLPSGSTSQVSNLQEWQNSAGTVLSYIDKDGKAVIGTLTVAGGSITDSSSLKICTATSQLLGFYNTAPVNQPDTVSDPSGGLVVDTEARTAINSIIDRLQELGLIA